MYLVMMMSRRVCVWEGHLRRAACVDAGPGKRCGGSRGLSRCSPSERGSPLNCPALETQRLQGQRSQARHRSFHIYHVKKNTQNISVSFCPLVTEQLKVKAVNDHEGSGIKFLSF